MGCDIHSWVEIKRKPGADWEIADPCFPLSDWEKEYYQKISDEHWNAVDPDSMSPQNGSYYTKRINAERTMTRCPFDVRNYEVFAFLADVRNYAAIPPFPLRHDGLPDDVTDFVRAESDGWGEDGHTHTWIDAKDLLEWDFEREVEDRRYTKQIGPNSWDGGATAVAGAGVLKKWSDVLGPPFMTDLAVIRQLHDVFHEVRIVFWFDN